MDQLIALIAARNAAVYEWAAVVLGLVVVWEFIVRRRLVAQAPALADVATIHAPTGVVAWFARHWFALFMVVVVGVRVWALDTGPYWYDEAFTVWLAQLPFERVLAATAGDVHPPLWYVLVWLWVRVVGEEPALVRLLPAACSIAAVPLARLLADRLDWPTEAQYVGLWLLAFSRFELFYASDVRMYSLMQLLFLGGAWCVLERRWGWLAVTCTLLLWTHYYGLFYSAALAALGLASELRYRRSPVAVVVAGGVAALSFMPWLAVLAKQMREVQAEHWIMPVTGADVLLTFYNLLFHNGPLYLEAFGFVAATALAGFAAFKSVRYPLTWPRVVLLWLIIGPMLLAVLVSLLWRSVYVVRYLLPIAPAYFLLIGWALTYRTGTWARLAMAVVLVPLLALGAATPDRAAQLERGRSVELAALIRAERRPGDVIVHTHPWTMVEMEQYEVQLPQYLSPSPDGLALGGLTRQTREAMGMREARLSDLRGYRRVWVVSAFGPLILPEQRRQSLDEALNGRRYQLRQRWVGERQLYGVEVYLVEVKQ